MTPLLINNDVFKPGYNELKFSVQNGRPPGGRHSGGANLRGGAPHPPGGAGQPAVAGACGGIDAKRAVKTALFLCLYLP